ncbi:MAG: serine hydrolase [Mediterranea sp.]|jgi:beta-glucosidase-like glycosyl hydrolase/CubicO group peptidase (beta-lactamase class C family)|nr:serine hydrolase [Mediterranea sp.]
MKHSGIILALLLGLLSPGGRASAQDSAARAAKQPAPYLLDKVSGDGRCQHWVDSVMQKLTLREKVGQLIVYTIEPSQANHNLALLHEVVTTYKVGGLLFSGGELPAQATLTNLAQGQAKIPLMITFDGEWGLAMRLRGTPAFPKNRVLGCIQDNRLIYDYGYEVARQCREIGVQVNFAPDVDVDNNPANPVINTRSFGEDPRQVAYKAVAYTSGLEMGGVLSVSKHFPGHGDTDVDSHHALPTIPFDRARLDSLELLPFRKVVAAGAGGVMVGHLCVPALGSGMGVPASLSREVVTGVLKGEMAFGGLVFTDALAMRGVATRKNLCLQALKAGNDILLAPRALKDELEAVTDAVRKGELSEEEIDRRCRKVLTFKYALGLDKRQAVRLANVGARVNTARTRGLIKRLNLAAITVLADKDDVLPLSPAPQSTPATQRESIALIEVGKTSGLAARLGEYATVTRFALRPGLATAAATRLMDSLSAYRRVVVAIGENKLTDYRTFLERMGEEVPGISTIYLFFTPQKSVEQIAGAVRNASAVILAHTTRDDVQRQVADVLFARATADGRLSTSIRDLFKAGDGITIRAGDNPSPKSGDEAFAIALSRQVDSIARAGIAEGAYPGCQVVIWKGGRAVVDKAYGTFAGKGSERVTTTSIYDVASLTKTTATLLAVMKLYDERRVTLTDSIGRFLPFLRGTDKAGISVGELLLHESGLPAWIPFYEEAIDKESYAGKLFSARRDARHTVRTGTRTWANPRFAFLKEYVSTTERDGYTTQVCDGIWLNRSFRSIVEAKIAEATLKPGRYVYSDINFLLLWMMVERLTGVPMDEYLAREFYRPMGLERTGYLPLRRFAKADIVPSADDRFLRKQVVRGFVNDESAAFLGGVAGNAGLFATAGEVARVYQMLLNGGTLDGHRYLSEATCALFTTRTSAISRRGLGFDRPDTKDPQKGNCAPKAPAEVYGHTGFTGACAWADPVNQVVYVFLSNRTYPDATNRTLVRLRIRERIQEAIYASPDGRLAP